MSSPRTRKPGRVRGGVASPRLRAAACACCVFSFPVITLAALAFGRGEWYAFVAPGVLTLAGLQCMCGSPLLDSTARALSHGRWK